jgi:hypothetical protein
VKTEKSQLKKKNRKFVQPKKIMEKSPFTIQNGDFCIFLVKTQKSQLKKMEKSATPKNEWRNLHSETNNFFQRLANKHVNFQKNEWRSILNGDLSILSFWLEIFPF